MEAVPIRVTRGVCLEWAAYGMRRKAKERKGKEWKGEEWKEKR